MEWTKPEWTEIPVGMEIGAYRAPEPEEVPATHADASTPESAPAEPAARPATPPHPARR